MIEKISQDELENEEVACFLFDGGWISLTHDNTLVFGGELCGFADGVTIEIKRNTKKEIVDILYSLLGGK
jgi:hypothetical protein